MAPVKIPASHLYLLQRAGVATLSTLGAQGTLLIMDHADSDTYLVLRCVVSRVGKEGAIAHLNRLTNLNMGLDRWYGGAVDDDPAERAERIIIHLQPERIYAI